MTVSQQPVMPLSSDPESSSSLATAATAAAAAAAAPLRSQGLDHFLWLTGDRGACDWPAEGQPALANIIKVVHFGWHHVGSAFGEPKGWEGQIKNKVGMVHHLTAVGVLSLDMVCCRRQMLGAWDNCYGLNIC
jgi:hypothetical protein